MIEVFQLSNYFNLQQVVGYASSLGPVSLQLLILFLIISIGIYALKGLEGMDLEGKVMNFVICAILIVIWPLLVVQMKDLVDQFNTFLIVDVFRFQNWQPDSLTQVLQRAFEASVPTKLVNGGILDKVLSVVGMPFFLGVNVIVSSLLVASRKIIEIFYVIFFFFYVALGPIVIARAIFSDHLEAFFELIQQFLVLMFWPTTYVVLMAFINKAAITGGALSGAEISSLGELIQALALAIAAIGLVAFVPTITKKFAIHVGASIVSPLLRWTGIALGLTGAEWFANASLGAGAKALGAAGASMHFAHSAEKYISLYEIMHEAKHGEHAHHQAHQLHHALHGAMHELDHGDHEEHGDHGGHHDDHHDDHHGGHEEHGDHGGHDDHHGSHGGHGEHHAEHGGHHEEHHEHHEEHHASHAHAHADHGAHGSHHAEATPSSPIPSSKIPHAKVSAAHGPAGLHKGAEAHAQSTSESPAALHRWVEKLAWKPSEIGKTWVRKIRKTDSDITTQHRLDEERDLARRFLGPVNSEKNTDMEECGINHADLYSPDIRVVTKYRKIVQAFHNKWGWLYDFEGRFSGRDDERPQAQLNEEETV